MHTIMIPTTFYQRFLYAAKLRLTAANVGFLLTSLVCAAAVPGAIYFVG
jgi:hypothetical protein